MSKRVKYTTDGTVHVVSDAMADALILSQRAELCTEAQGYHFSRPISATDAGRLIERLNPTAQVA